MSIVIPVGVDTADTSYLDMAAGSEWVTPTTSPNLHCSHLLCPSLPYFSHSYKPLVGLWSSSMPKVHSHLHRHCSHLSPFFGVIQNHLTPLFEKNMISSSHFLSICPNMPYTMANSVALFNSLCPHRFHLPCLQRYCSWERNLQSIEAGLLWCLP